MDTKTGMQLGICWVKFNGPLLGKEGSGHDVALQVVQKVGGQRIGMANSERVKVTLDGRGILAAKAVKDEMERRLALKTKAALAMGVPIREPIREAPSTSQKAANEPRVPPSGPKGFPMPRGGPLTLPNRPRPVPAPLPQGFGSLGRSLPVRPLDVTGWSATNYSRPGFASSVGSSFTSAPFDRRNDRFQDLRDFSSSSSPSRRRSRSRSWSTSSSSYTSDSEDDHRSYRRRQDTKVSTIASKPKEDENIQLVKKTIDAQRYPYIHIAATIFPTSPSNEAYLRDHFRAFKPAQVGPEG